MVNMSNSSSLFISSRSILFSFPWELFLFHLCLSYSIDNIMRVDASIFPFRLSSPISDSSLFLTEVLISAFKFFTSNISFISCTFLFLIPGSRFSITTSSCLLQFFIHCNLCWCTGMCSNFFEDFSILIMFLIHGEIMISQSPHPRIYSSSYFFILFSRILLCLIVIIFCELSIYYT